MRTLWVVIDGSGSMYGGADPIPATVALSLGIYYAELNTGSIPKPLHHIL